MIKCDKQLCAWGKSEQLKLNGTHLSNNGVRESNPVIFETSIIARAVLRRNVLDMCIVVTLECQIRFTFLKSFQPSI